MKFDLTDKGILARKEERGIGGSREEKRSADAGGASVFDAGLAGEKAGGGPDKAAGTPEKAPEELAREKLAAELAAAESLRDLSEAEQASLEKNLSRLERFALRLEQSKIAEYMDYLSNPRRLIRMNFLMGLARGFGFAVGLTVLSALIIYILQMVIRLNVPVISKFIADILIYANEYLKLYKFPS